MHELSKTNQSLITENALLKQRIQELEISQNILTATQKLTKVGGWEWDVAKQTMTWTEEAYRIHDFDPAEFMPGSTEHIERSLECYRPGDRFVIREAFRRCAEHGEPYDMELPFTTAKGRCLWIRTAAEAIMVGGQVSKVIGNIMDITERKRMEEELRESEERFRSFMDNSPTIAWMKDEHGRHVYLSKTYEKRFDVKSDEWLGKTDFELWPREIAEEFWKNDQIVLKSAQTIEVTEKTPGKNGDPNYWWNFKFLCTDVKGRKYVGGVGVDITSRKKAEEELIKHREYLEILVRERTADLENKKANLEEMNTALKVLLQQREKDKDELEEKILANVKKLIMPYIEKLKKSCSKDKEAVYVDILESSLINIISPFSNKLSSKFLNLTPKEIEIANLIKEGKTTKEIGELSHVSPGTVAFHRQNIRMKLHLTNKKENLRSYLLTLS